MCSYKCIHMLLVEMTCSSYDLLVFQSDDTVIQKDGFEKTDMVLSNTASLWGIVFEASSWPVLWYLLLLVAWKAFLRHSFIPLKCLSVPKGNGDEISNFGLKNFKVFDYSQQPHDLVISITLKCEQRDTLEHITNRNITSTYVSYQHTCIGHFERQNSTDVLFMNKVQNRA